MPKTSHSKTSTRYSEATQRSTVQIRRGFPIFAGLQSSPIEITSDEEIEEASTEVLMISSDEAENDRKVSSLRPGECLLQSGTLGVPGVERPIVINSQSLGEHKSLKLELAKLRQEMNALVKAVSKELKAEKKWRVQTASKITQLKAELAREKEKHISTVNILANIMMCDICRERMSKPATLECGHMFCQTCVARWFSTIEGRHSVYGNLSSQYTCPMCRKSVGRPVECLKMRELVSAVADATPTD